MLSLFNPLALLGLGLLAIPVVIHLFKPRKVRQVPFSSLRWLRASQHRMSRRIKWHQLLLFFLRAAFLTLLVLALAQPVLSIGGAGPASDRFVILDLSRTMAYDPAAGGRDDQPAPIEAARQIAQRLALQGAAGDRTAVILANATPRVLSPLTADLTSQIPTIMAAQPEAAEADLSAALASIRSLMSAEQSRNPVELTFISDNPRQRWPQNGIAAFTSFAQGLGRSVRTRLIDVSPETPRNAWIAEAARTGQAIQAIVGWTADEAQDRTVRLSNLAGLPEMTERVHLEPHALAQVRFALPPDYDVAGKVALLKIEPGDGLPDDDRFWLNLSPPAMARVLVVEPEAPRATQARPGLHLRAALSAIASSTAGGIAITERFDKSVTASEIAQADVILLAEVPSLSDSAVEAIRQRVQSGGGLVVFVGPSADPDFYNRALHRSDDPSMSLIPAQLGKLVHTPPVRGRTLRLTDVQWTHPVLTRMDDPAFGDLADAGFYAYFELAMDPANPDSRTLARLGGEVPAIVEHRVGEGSVLLLNTSANDLWTDLPRRRSFVPLVDRMLSYLSGGLTRCSFAAGQAVVLPLPEADESQPVRVTMPDGTSVTTEAHSLAGRSVLRLAAANQSGVYEADYVTVSGESRRLSFVAQLDRTGSGLVRAEEKTLAAWWAPAPLEVIRPDPRNPRAIAGAQRFSLTPWLVALACLAMLAEMLWVHRVCPAMNPNLAKSVVAERGFVKT